MGLVAMLLYKDVALGLVMMLAMTLNLLLAALDGRADPDDDAEASAAIRRSARRC